MISAAPDFSVDLTNCDREPIHALGAVQPFGFLVAVSADWLVTRASANLAEFLGIDAEEALGTPLRALLGDDVVHQLRNRLTLMRGTDAVERVFGVQVDTSIDRKCYDFALHIVGSTVIVEGEPCGTPEGDTGSIIRAMMGRLDDARDMAGFYREGARQIRALTAFDRVMVYRFDRDGSGIVVAEAARSGIGSFLNLRYPASDIPQQARALYLRNPFRIIADVTAVPVGLVPQRDERGQPLDLSLSVLRSVSPIHIEYLQNMGVAASLSISIIIEGKLWGLFVCHHYAPRIPSFERRSIAELFGQMFAFKLEARERQALAGYETAARATSDRLLSAVATDAALLNDTEWLGETLRQTIPCDGVAVWLDGNVGFSGLTPPSDALPVLVRRLNAMASGRVYATDHLTEVLPSAEDYAADAAGVLAIPISRSPRDYVLLFRQEKVRTIDWAGDPHKPASYGPNGARLSPRLSFATWSQEVRNRAEPFSDSEMRVAETLRASLIEVVLRLSDDAVAERRKAGERQELLIAELNHRVRNILALIRGLVRQSRDPALDTKSYVDMLEGRVEALARAHDQITQQNWAAAPLAKLIETEAQAYLGAKSDRLTATGPAVVLEPQAFTTLALVLHELATNSAKYGALADNGRVAVTWAPDDAGMLQISWRETGGPVVQAPSRQGFGTTIIKRSIPYDLGGTADVQYAPLGLVAEFGIPERHWQRAAAPPAPAARETDPSEPLPAAAFLGEEARSAVLSGAVLLVEDSMIIAMDAEDILSRLGAERVVTVSGVRQALDELASESFTFAVLDVNLGSETSLPIADALKARAVPFAFATGYGEQFKPPADHAAVKVIQKPYTIETVARTLAG